MPENAYRRSHLAQHLAASTRHAGSDVNSYYGHQADTAQLARLRREHPDWPMCTEGCGWPVDPAGADPNQPDQHLNQPCGGPGAVHGDRQRTTGA